MEKPEAAFTDEKHRDAHNEALEDVEDLKAAPIEDLNPRPSQDPKGSKDRQRSFLRALTA